MASKKLLKEALNFMEKSRDYWRNRARDYRNDARILANEVARLEETVSQFRDSLEKQNEQATELHLDNALLNNNVFDQVVHANAQSDFIAAQSDYITHLVNRVC